MTREDAIQNLNMISVAFVKPVTKEQRGLIDDTFYMAIKSLKQEPKTGQWIKTDKRIKDNLYVWKATCCGREFIADADLKSRDNYCLNCGAKMKSATETWKGYHGYITAPKGTFDKIFNEAKEDDNDI